MAEITEKINFKKIWIISAILGFLVILFSCLFLVESFFNNNYLFIFLILYLILSLSLTIIPNLVLKGAGKIQRIFFILLSITSFILSVPFPVISLLPLITLTAVKSEKKAHIIKWLLGIVLLIITVILSGAGLLATYMMISDSQAAGTTLILWTTIMYFIINLPVITLFGIILGNKKSPFYYLMLLPALAVIVIIYADVITDLF